MAMPQADWRSAVPVDLAPGTVTAPVPVITSGAQAIQVARDYAASIATGAIERDRSGAVPARELAALDVTGLLGIPVPRAYGGADLPVTVLAEVVREIAAVDPAIAQVPQSHFLYVDVLAVLAPPPLRQRLYGEVLAGARLGNAMAERGGPHAQDLKTKLIRTGTGLRLAGRKYYCTGALTARWVGVTALDDADRLVLAFVERDAPGVSLDQDWNVMGQRATVSGGAVFDDVAVDPGLVMPYQQAFEVPQQLGARAQLVHAAIEAGIAGGALRDATTYLKERPGPSREAAKAAGATAAADDPHVLHRYGRAATRVRAAEALLADAAATLEEIGLVPEDEAAAVRGSLAVAGAKAFASEVAVEVASELFQLA